MITAAVFCRQQRSVPNRMSDKTKSENPVVNGLVRFTSQTSADITRHAVSLACEEKNTHTNRSRIHNQLLKWHIQRLQEKCIYIGEDLPEECFEIIKSTSNNLFLRLKLQRQIWRLLNDWRCIVEITAQWYNLLWCRYCLIDFGMVLFNQLKGSLYNHNNMHTIESNKNF